MTDIEKLIKLLEHAESFSLEAYGKSPNLSECSRQFYYLHDCILQALGNARALRERLAQPEQWGMDVLGGDWNKFALAAAAILKETK